MKQSVLFVCSEVQTLESGKSLEYFYLKIYRDRLLINSI